MHAIAHANVRKYRGADLLNRHDPGFADMVRRCIRAGRRRGRENYGQSHTSAQRFPGGLEDTVTFEIGFALNLGGPPVFRLQTLGRRVRDLQRSSRNPVRSRVRASFTASA
jgi:hypothetical protein